MKKIRTRLTFANVIACLALFIALGGASYAATQLPKNSVGAKQLKKKAVTPAKLAPATRTALRGAPGIAGPAGPRGAAGPKGDPGAPGAPGPAATTVALTVPQGEGSVKPLATYGGVVVGAVCTSGSAYLNFASSNSTSPEIFGTGSVGGPTPIDVHVFNSTTGFETENPNGSVSAQVIFRNPSVDAHFTTASLYLRPGECVVNGVVTPSS